jgi:short subunit dehydrogenase-like uncharacterized protein
MTVAVYGAYGYTGRLVVAELARRCLNMALLGRDRDRLGRVAAAYDVPPGKVRVAATDDPAVLAAALRDCAVVINCAGPFTVAGPAVVRAAIAARCHYVDIAGEQLYMKRVYDTLGGAAERAGVSVILAANDDGLPSDLIAALTARPLGPVDELVIGLELVRGDGATPSRGTLRSALASRDSFLDGGLGYAGGRWAASIPARRSSMMLPLSGQVLPVAKFPLPGVVTVPRHVPARHVEGVASQALAAGFAAMTADMINAVPEGPSETSRGAGRWGIAVEAVDATGRKVRGVVHGHDMQATTAAVAVEAAQRLVTQPQARPGVLAPAEAFAPEDFLDALAPHGVTWSTGNY